MRFEMALTAGEFFINLGINGAEKAINSLSNIDEGMKNLWDSSIAAKTAIVGALVGIEQLYSHSGQLGANLNNTSIYLDEGVIKLQQFQNAARNANVPVAEMDATLKNLKKSMTAMTLGGQAPAGFGMLMMATGAQIGPQQIREFAKDPTQLLMLIEKALSNSKIDQATKNSIAEGMQVAGEAMISALSKNLINPNNFLTSETLSKEEVENLARGNVALNNFIHNLEILSAKFLSLSEAPIFNFLSDLTSEPAWKVHGSEAEKQRNLKLKKIQEEGYERSMAATGKWYNLQFGEIPKLLDDTVKSLYLPGPAGTRAYIVNQDIKGGDVIVHGNIDEKNAKPIMDKQQQQNNNALGQSNANTLLK
jgi:hypothetical protein